ncbi:MAG: alpha-xylosidase [Chloroflexota bacterium]|nr:alpha-xylosidase [Chloroflexota bacterium]
MTVQLTTGHVARRMQRAGLTVGATCLDCDIVATAFARVAYGDRLVTVTDDATPTRTPNQPRLDHDLIRESRVLPLKLQIVSARTVRLRLGRPTARTSDILLEPEPPGLPLSIQEGDAIRVVAGGDLTVTLEADPFALRIERPDGPPFTLAGLDRNVFGQPVTLPLAVIDGALAPSSTIGWTVSRSERLYGLGERFAAFNQRGRNVALWATDAWGTTTRSSYKGCPIIFSSARYAVFAHTIAPVQADLGATSGSSCTMTVEDEGLDLFIFLGPDLKAILADYTALTGRCPMPPRWAFGLWASRCRYETRDEVEKVVARLDKEEIPVDVVNLDPAWLRTPALNCDFEWDHNAFPDPPGMVRSLAEKGVNVCLWEVPYLAEGTALHAEAQAKGYLLHQADGEPVTMIDGAFRPDLRRGIVDFTNPAAAAWWKNLHAALLDMGIAAFKTDFGEGVPADAQAANGLSGRQLRNLYPLLYNRTVWEATAASHDGAGFVWGRSGWAGSQRYPAQWGGDPPATVEGFAASLRGGLNWALSAPGVWTHDIGGFFGPPPSPGLYIRWAQCGLLSPLARFHGTTPREPWHFGDEALRIFREYAQLRYRLLPYLFSVAWEAHRSGLPMLRPLVLEFPHDRLAWGIDDQYLLGGSLLVSPVFSDQLKPVAHSVYLPEGEWVDFWSGELLNGGRYVSRDVPLDQLPLFVRRGRLLPMGPPMRRVDDDPLDPLTIRCAPSGDTDLVLPEADGSTTRLALHATETSATFSVEGSVRRRYSLELVGVPQQSRATLAGQQLPVRVEQGIMSTLTPPIESGDIAVTW